MPEYSKCVIYKLCCKDLNIKEIYVGSTCNFTRRKSQHKHICCNENAIQHNFKVYKFIRDNGGWDNWDMILIEEFACENKLQKLQRERHWYEELKSTLNGDVPGRSDKEYRDTHKQQMKEYREENKQKIIEQMKEYYEENREKILEQKKEKSKEKITCECGSVFRSCSKPRHDRSKKHLDYINKN
jgi:hypothetical protein